MIDQLESRFRAIQPDVDFVSLRYVDERHENLAVRQNIVQPTSTSRDVGAMLTVIDGDGLGYAATSDLSESGLREAVKRATAWARRTQGRGVADFGSMPLDARQGEYQSQVGRTWDSLSLKDKIDLLREHAGRIKKDDRIVDWVAALTGVSSESLLLTSNGGRLHQRFRFVVPHMVAIANEGTETQRRTLGGYGMGRQGGLEILDEIGFTAAPERLADEALELLSAPDCPEGTMDLILAPDQMILQIHESIGHPIELDRILGDERNYAGTSFVTLDMFGSYQYGSELLNVTFDPTRTDELASYGFDDDGMPAEREYVIKEGVLLRPLGGRTSQVRAGVPGVANSRASSWNRPPIDRMANLNLEPGDSSIASMVQSVERGVLMETNCSWSIDDSRNKFQFGCEHGRVIEDGELKHVVKKCNYRGISATFWRNLKGVGTAETVEVMGTPHCGKGEPNQMIRVGHASPTCLFGDVEVFAGD
ncbi:MAG: TldD/PmbA family protein [Planctomycetota bacterium]|nr:TldD/PmbA family protein [Planctomycetota bacterium]